VRSDRLYFEDIASSIVYVEEDSSGGQDEFLRNRTKRDAILRNLQIIGEAARSVSEESKTRYPELPWKGLVAFRNVAVHGYSTLDLDEIWAIIRDDLPPLKVQVERILQELPES
jgi:uncharacterized protein with HEPN domain